MVLLLLIAVNNVSHFHMRETHYLLVVVVHLDLKECLKMTSLRKYFLVPCFGTEDEFRKRLDDVIMGTLGRSSVFSPSNLRRFLLQNRSKKPFSNNTTAELIRLFDWPTMTTLYGKFILVMSGYDFGEVHRRRKAYEKYPNRLAFVDIDQRWYMKHFRGNVRNINCSEFWSDLAASQESVQMIRSRVFFNISYRYRKYWKTFSKCITHHKLISRIWRANSYDEWNESVTLMNIISTDLITVHDVKN